MAMQVKNVSNGEKLNIAELPSGIYILSAEMNGAASRISLVKEE
jgi:hypothetical protein